MKYTITELRARKKISMEELANRMGVSTQIVFMWEHGKIQPTVKNAIKLAETLEVAVEDIEWE